MSLQYPFATITMGGTFNALHVGHKQYLEIGCRIAERAIVHVTTDAFAYILKPYKVKSYEERVAALERFLTSLGRTAEFRALDSNEQIRDFCVDCDVSIALVEPAYLALFQDINIERRLRRLSEMYILVKPRTMIDGADVSSRTFVD